MPTGGAFGSDFGVMLAWSRITADVAKDENVCLVLCDDPWLFRHLAKLSGVTAGRPPRLRLTELKLSIRGWLARTKTALKNALFSTRLVKTQGQGSAAILVYGHPRSTADGFDAYFGDLMAHEPELQRILHTDCDAARARELSSKGRTSSLHAWGHTFFALRLIWTKWRPGRVFTEGKYGWLVRRAAAKENSGGGPAMNRWQLHCQDNWLKEAKPSRVCWPWENHSWERGLCRAGRKHGVHTLGYQHTVVGPHQINYSTRTNPDGLDSIPEIVICDGPAYRDEVAAWGVPDDRLIVGGAFRFKRFAPGSHDPSGPVFVPLSAVPAAAQKQIEAAHLLAASGQKVLVKGHPMYPVAFSEIENLSRTETPLTEQAGLSAVLFCTGTSGLEAVLMGLPAYRLMLDDRIAIDILPANINVPSVTLDDVTEQVTGKVPIRPVNWDSVLTEPDINLWHSLLFGDMHAMNDVQEPEKKQVS
ncbi:MAG: hypothetical protein HOI45_08295 [Rhodospirillaceae bacterium]|nr:hypothetical protein [Rhodospirillaceae bacterium]